MVETGIVKFFNSRKQFGFIYVLDGNGEKTGKELFFHYNEGVYPALSDKLHVDFSEFTTRGCQRLRFPRKNDRLVFTSEDDSHYDRAEVGWTLVSNETVKAWSYPELWEDEERKLLTTPFKWRLLRRTWETYTSYEEGPGSLQHADDRPVSGSVMRRGEALLSEIRTWRGKNFNLYKRDPYEDDGNQADYDYIVQVQLEDGQWVTACHIPLEEYV